MLPKSTLLSVAFLLLGSSETVLGREQWLERDGKAVFLYPRRFGQEQPAVIQKLSAACPGQVCGTLAGAAVTPLLAAQPECSQQDLADQIIDASKQFDAATQANMLAIAKEYRQTEKNTPPDFTTNPPALRNSVFCQKAPKNPELDGLVQAQDPNNDPELFFDPALKATVKKGTQANTAPFGGAAAAPAASSSEAATTATATATALPDQTADPACPTAVTVTVTGTAPTASASDVPTVTVGDGAATTTADSPAPTAVGDADFGSCSVPEIEFAAGFDNRRETSFQPKDKASFNHGSAQNINIITRAICDTLVNTCKANQAAKDLCATALQAAADATPAKTGGQADAFNKVFGIETNFAQVQPIDDQGRAVGAAPASTATASDSTAASSTAASTDTATANLPAATPVAGTAGDAAIGNFGKCSVPEIEFAVGFDNRKETSFQPKDKASFNHGSAQNIDIITQFICDTLTNSCAADATAKATCASAITASKAATKGSGGQADAFNAVFGINTNFNAVAAVDNQGRVVGAAAADAPQPTADQPAQNNASNNNNNNDNNNADAGTAASADNLQQFNGALGGVAAPTVTALGGGQFQVTGNAAFNNLRNALVRSCDVQNNQCANAANGGDKSISVGQCNAQQATCIAQAGN